MPDPSHSNASRLSRIDTLWSVVRRAHDADDGSAIEAQQELLARYGGAIRRYLLAAVRDREVADELFQDFALKFVRGDFKDVEPDRGRFRAFVKTVLYRMVALHFRKRGTRKVYPLEQVPDQQFDAKSPSAEFERAFLDSWRDDLLATTWKQLDEYERAGGGPYHTVLRLRVEHSSLSTELLARRISEKLGKSTSAGSGRVLLHRAREKFARLLIQTVADSLQDATDEAIELELVELQLIDYCRDALEQRKAGQ